MTIFPKPAAKTLLVCVATMGLTACATTNGADEAAYGDAQWAANGWLTPGASGEPEIIGLYLTRKACEDAVDEWMARQAAGNPIRGECLPIDRH